ncbi:elongation factor 1-beta [Candidatus Woesearchaeota archaeon]|nr:elongation factor 1-beta [Candidatus Woesearchaeota archaeon]
MARVEVTFKIMPEGPDTDLKKVLAEATKKIEEFGGKIFHTEEEPIGFGLKAVKVSFKMDEAKGDTEPLENTIKTIPHVLNVEVTNVTRALG